jgi:hypothetical protein
MADKWIHPGHFDTLKLNARKMTVLKDGTLRAKYAKEHSLKTEAEIIEEMKHESIDSLEKFLNKFGTRHSPIYPETFLHYHA